MPENTNPYAAPTSAEFPKAVKRGSLDRSGGGKRLIQIVTISFVCAVLGQMVGQAFFGSLTVRTSGNNFLALIFPIIGLTVWFIRQLRTMPRTQIEESTGIHGMTEPPPDENWMERRFCQLNDFDWTWAGLQWARPQQHEHYTFNLVLLLTLIVNIPAGCLFAIATYYFSMQSIGWDEIAITEAVVVVIMTPTVASSLLYIGGHYWNRCATRIRQLSSFKLQSDANEAGLETLPDSETNPFKSPMNAASIAERQSPAPLPLSRLFYGADLYACASFFLLALFLYWRGVQYRTDSVAAVMHAYREAAVVGAIFLLVAGCVMLFETPSRRKISATVKILISAAFFVYFAHCALNPPMIFDEFRYAWFATCCLITTLTGLYQFRQPATAK